MNNISLIGMPGSGKSTIGVLLAKACGFSFIDTDLLIQCGFRMPLQEIIEKEGIEEFIRRENGTILTVNPERCVIATGGSAVLCPPAMDHLKRISTVAYISADINRIKGRIRNITSRGIVMMKNQSIADVFMEREPLYKRYADITVDGNADQERVVEEILKALSFRSGD